jgi:drug/metabolite transporter (DMT)-like permease
MKRILLAYFALLVIGAGWASSTPMVKTATLAGHHPTGIMVLQTAANVVIIGLALALSGALRRLPMDRAHLRLYLVVGLFGMSVPHLVGLTATAMLPSGVMSILYSLVPLFTLPLALVLGIERPGALRIVGVLAGAMAIAVLIGPEASLPEPGLWVWVLFGALAPLCYSIEGMYVSQSRALAAGPFTVLWVGSVLALGPSVVLVLLFDGFYWPEAGAGWAEAALFGSGLVSVCAYTAFLVLLRRTGPVFGAQVSYVVTGLGVVFAFVFLGERYSAWVWAALALLFVGLFMVQPRKGVLAQAAGEADGVV